MLPQQMLKMQQFVQVEIIKKDIGLIMEVKVTVHYVHQDLQVIKVQLKNKSVIKMQHQLNIQKQHKHVV